MRNAILCNVILWHYDPFVKDKPHVILYIISSDPFSSVTTFFIFSYMSYVVEEVVGVVI